MTSPNGAPAVRLDGRVVVITGGGGGLGRAYARLAAGQPMAGVLVAPQRAAAGAVVDDLELIAAVSAPEDWAGRVTFLPLR